MKWLWLLAPGGLLVIVALALWQRRRDAEDASLVPQLQRWQHADPQIQALPLPPVRPLIAVRVDRVARFKQRMAGGR